MTKPVPKNTKAPPFKMAQSKAKAEVQAEENAPWWDEWNAGNRHSETFLHIPYDMRELPKAGELAQYRHKIRASM